MAKRNQTIQVAVSEAEKVTLRAVADRTGRSMSSLLRTAGLALVASEAAEGDDANPE